ncbi:hypothetical protein QR680_014527 [Steinernema hermaphroditum]|uniref:Uncharacterized protein n=1 Tax=Steinernema hermaphroditum TaxID=289476 RepID=A0AA39M3B8_9BILA|nr:hypothetical protein QR680_014527 [Steinernema hermaphroditum]
MHSTPFPLTDRAANYVIGNLGTCTLKPNYIERRDTLGSFRTEFKCFAESGPCTQNCYWHQVGKVIFRMCGPTIYNSKKRVAVAFDLKWGTSEAPVFNKICISERSYFAGVTIIDPLKNQTLKVIKHLGGPTWKIDFTQDFTIWTAFDYKARAYLIDAARNMAYSLESGNNMTYQAHKIHTTETFLNTNLAHYIANAVVVDDYAYILSKDKLCDLELGYANPSPDFNLFKLDMTTFQLTNLTADLRRSVSFRKFLNASNHGSCFYLLGKDGLGKKVYKIDFQEGAEAVENDDGLPPYSECL